MASRSALLNAALGQYYILPTGKPANNCCELSFRAFLTVKRSILQLDKQVHIVSQFCSVYFKENRLFQKVTHRAAFFYIKSRPCFILYFSQDRLKAVNSAQKEPMHTDIRKILLRNEWRAGWWSFSCCGHFNRSPIKGRTKPWSDRYGDGQNEVRLWFSSCFRDKSV